MNLSMRVSATLSVIALAACFGGDGNDAHGAGMGAAGSGGASAGTGGASGHAITGGVGGTSGISTAGASGGGAGGMGSGSGGAGGSGGSNPCPSTPPTDGTPCSEAEAAFCTYHDCAGAGETNARCQAPVLSMWLVETKPCEAVDCGFDTMCTPGQVCMEERGGALGISCIDDPCGSGPQGCDCPGVCATCTSFSGNTLVCNSCPAGEECL